MGNLILASGSPYRQELLKRIASNFQVIVPQVDEDSVKQSGLSPVDVASCLARMKAAAVAADYPDAVVIGSDQLVDLNGRILGKPGTAERACQQLQDMSGQSHRLLTAVCVMGPGHGQDRCFLQETVLWMRPLDHQEISAYVSRDQPLDCAGSYRIEAAGISLFEKIDTGDFTAIMGLPLIQLAAELRALGVRLL
ncbi:MAG: hypothetical protein RLZZ232_177 [Planctomycetota bacterium]|jgi:septum formation protein